MVNGIECGVCGRWAHKKCSLIRPDLYLVYRQHLDIDWVCMLCKDAARAAYQLEMKETETIPITEGSGKASYVGVTHAPTYLEVASTAQMEVSKEAKGVKEIIKKMAQPVVGKKEAPVCPPIKKNAPKRKGGNKQQLGADNGVQSSYQELEKKLEVLRREVDSLRPLTNRKPQNTVLVLNNEEPVIREAKARRDLDRRRAMDILRLAGVNPVNALKRVHRVGVWKNPGPGRTNPARPIVMELSTPNVREMVLTRAAWIYRETNGRFNIVPDQRRPNGAPGWNPRPLRWERRNDPRPQAFGNHTRNPSGVVIIEDVMEQLDESELQSEAGEDWVTIGLRNKGDPATPIRRASTPLRDFEEETVRLRSFAESFEETIAKNEGSPRVLRPRMPRK